MSDLDIAIVGMAGRFPGARTLDQFWKNLREGVESIHVFTDEELLSAGVDPAALKSPDYVKASPILDDIESFDAGFFNFSPLEAKVMDPQRRLFLESCWHALEDAGYDPANYPGTIGVYAGAGLNTYLLQNVLADEALVRSLGLQQLLIGSDKDFLPTHVSYKLNLTGPSVNVNTACSTSLVTVHLARQALLLGECDMALAGGVSLNVPQQAGYFYVQDSIQSPDGHCRAFDAKARGTLWGSGCGVLVLKRLADALADGDDIRAVIKGSAINNDGALKVGYTAPSVDGQAQVIVQALATADVEPSSISYIEAHGTGTEVGDPIEVAALTQAFRMGTDQERFCALGSVKTNIGHLNAAAGAAGLIKTVLALEAKQLPPSLNFETPNPKIDFEHSPFFVNTRLTDWKPEGHPRRAGVSSLGIGGTNAHVIVEEAPARSARTVAADGRVHALVLSARSAAALDEATRNLADHLEANAHLPLQDVAFTLQCGRRAFSHRRAVVCRSVDEAIRALRERRFEPEGSTVEGGRLQRWLAGEDVDWAPLYEGHEPRRVRLPLYPFERKRLWVDPPNPGERKPAPETGDSFWRKRPDMADWFYRPQWKQSALPLEPEAAGAKRETFLVFADGTSLIQKLVKRLERAGTVITVTPGASFSRQGSAAFTLPVGDRGAYESLVAALRDEDRLPDRIVHCWALDAGETPRLGARLDDLMAAQERGLFSLLFLAQALSQCNVTRPLRVLAFTNDVFEVTGLERLRYEQTSVSGICRVLQQEYNNIVCRAVDLVLPPAGTWREDALADELAREVRSSCRDILCAYRGPHRSVPYYEPVRVEAQSPRVPLTRKGETYLVFYGLEGIGFLVARRLLEEGARLIILEEPDFPAPTEWGMRLGMKAPRDPVNIRIGNAVGLQAMGHDFILEKADFDDVEALRRIIEKAEARSGPIRGVIHAAGASNFERVKAIRDATPATCRQHFAAIPHSLRMLDTVFRERDLRFRVVMSSLGSVLGGLGFTAIASACGVASSFTSYLNREHAQKWVVQYWDSWDIEWRKAKGLVHDSMWDRVAPSVLTEQEGLECFLRCFSVTGATLVAVSATDLERRYEKWVKLEPVRQAQSQSPAGEEDGARPRKQRRPELEAPFIEPRNELERTIANVYEELLGVERVGVHDGFVELGGHSLLATQMLSRMREVLKVDLELFTLMEHSNVASLAAHVSQMREARG
uniref:Phenolphthiocerol/phthiocerol polyketide synthase subunit E n=1 Tax=Pyxidicoccus sp. MCy9557 TaxID=2012863 RepID=A0A1Z2TJN2_9BACT|nr:polyketide synthase [Pyxidicoccus sp. MCy9557]